MNEADCTHGFINSLRTDSTHSDTKLQVTCVFTKEILRIEEFGDGGDSDEDEMRENAEQNHLENEEDEMEENAEEDHLGNEGKEMTENAEQDHLGSERKDSVEKLSAESDEIKELNVEKGVEGIKNETVTSDEGDERIPNNDDDKPKIKEKEVNNTTKVEVDKSKMMLPFSFVISVVNVKYFVKYNILLLGTGVPSLDYTSLMKTCGALSL